jgi:hypothetical protein
MEIRPHLLVPNQNVSIKFVAKEDQRIPAYVQYLSNALDRSYEVVINTEVAKKMLEDSWLNDKISLDDFLVGLLLHELAHVRYGSFDHATKRRNRDNVIFGYVENVLEDARIEYRLTYEFPAYRQYISWLIAVMKSKVSLYPGLAVEKGVQIHDMGKDLDVLYDLVRFGLVGKYANPKFVSFALPLVLSAIRGDRLNVNDAANAIYHYLVLDHSVLEEAGGAKIVRFIEYDAIKNEDLDKLNDCEQVLQSQILEVKEQVEQTHKAGIGLLPGASGAKLVVEEKDSGFYRQTVQMYKALILRLRSVFKRLFESAVIYRDYDGDLDITRQQTAYLNSFTNDVGLDYQRYKLVDPELDLLILRDVSGSTVSMQIPYTQAIVCILAALEGLKGVRTRLVEFNNTFVETKSYEEEVREARIFPRANGGTDLLRVLKEVCGDGWRASNRLVFVITDGMVVGPGKCKQQMDVLERQYGIKFFMLEIRQDRIKRRDDVLPIEFCRLEELPNVIAAKVIGRFRREN